MDYSVQKPIWPGSSSFQPGDTPFGFFDNDAVFQQHADKFAKLAAQTLGYPIMDVELQDINFYTAFEAAIVEYSNQVNQVNIVNNLVNTLGIKTESAFLTDESFTGALVGNSFGYITKLSKAYGTEADSGGTLSWKTVRIDVEPGQQTYNLITAISKSLGLVLSSGSIEVKRVLHNPPPAIVRYFDPFVGTGLGSQQLLDAFDFGGFSPSVSFMMMPINADLFRLQAIEFNDMVRKSAYSFEILGNNKLRIFPIPSENFKLYIDYIVESERDITNFYSGSRYEYISDPSDIPYEYCTYCKINQPGKQWIKKYFLALCKETLGRILQKYSTVPIPGGEVTLDGAELRSEAKEEKDSLLEKLRDMLEKTLRVNQLENKGKESEEMNKMLSRVPLHIYIG